MNMETGGGMISYFSTMGGGESFAFPSPQPQQNPQGVDKVLAIGPRGDQEKTSTPHIAISYGFHHLVSTLQRGGSGDQQQGFGLTEFKQEHFADQPYMRNFIASSVETFTKARSEYLDSGNQPLSSEALGKLSRSYRAIILDAMQALDALGEQESAMLFSHLDFVWYFCEIMFLSSHPELPILPYLMSWIEQNFFDEKLQAELNPFLPNLGGGGAGPSGSAALAIEQDNLQKTWHVIHLHTFHGRTVEASKLLPFTNISKSKSYQEQIVLLQELMRKKPVFTPISNSVSEFESQWYTWHEECESRLHQKAFHGNEQLLFLAKILAGDPEGFNEAKPAISTWYEYLIMMLNYQFPTVRPGVLKGYARKAIEEFGDFGLQLTPIEEVILSAMDYEIVAVLKLMQNHFKHPWFALHFSDLMYYDGIPTMAAAAAAKTGPGSSPNQLNQLNIDYDSITLIRDDMLQEYGTSLMQHSSCWEIGLKYLEAISARAGLPIIAQLLRKRKPTTEFEAEKLIKICEKFEFGEAAQGICKEMALNALNNSRTQLALLWSIRSTDVPLTTKIVDQILGNDDDVLNIAPMLLNYLPNLYNSGERLLFLKGFSEFRNCLNEGNYEAAIVVLCQLIHDHLIPSRMAGKVLAYLHKFGEIGFKFRSEEISTLMEYVHTKLDRSSVSEEEFQKLNKILLMNRAHSLLTTFRAAKKEKEMLLLAAKS